MGGKLFKKRKPINSDLERRQRETTPLLLQIMSMTFLRQYSPRTRATQGRGFPRMGHSLWAYVEGETVKLILETFKIVMTGES